MPSNTPVSWLLQIPFAFIPSSGHSLSPFLSGLQDLKSSLLPLTKSHCACICYQFHMLHLFSCPLSLLSLVACLPLISLFFMKWKNQLLHFEGSTQINHSLPIICQSGLKDGSIADHPANNSSFCCPSFILGEGRFLTDAVKPPLLSFISLTVKTT